MELTKRKKIDSLLVITIGDLDQNNISNNFSE